MRAINWAGHFKTTLLGLGCLQLSFSLTLIAGLSSTSAFLVSIPLGFVLTMLCMLLLLKSPLEDEKPTEKENQREEGTGSSATGEEPTGEEPTEEEPTGSEAAGVFDTGRKADGDSAPSGKYAGAFAIFTSGEVSGKERIKEFLLAWGCLSLGMKLLMLAGLSLIPSLLLGMLLGLVILRSITKWLYKAPSP